jgi:ABC-2 family transporter protein
VNKYLAVIKDSFREALVSRVLWLLLVLITLLLLVIAPLGYHEVVTWRLGDGDVRGWEHLMDKVRVDGPKEEPSPSKRIHTLFDDELQKRLAKVKIPGVDKDANNPFEFIGLAEDFRKSLNEQLERTDFYDEASFESVPMLSKELRDLRDADMATLDEPDVARFNRLLLEASFPDLVRGSPPTSVQLKYGWWEFFDPIPLRRATLQEWLQSGAAFVMTWFVGAIGVLVAILVTSPIVPQMFETGSLHLLLSKPISRWLLFLSKFVGGCSFICICATYLVVGMWLILGTRFGVWDPKLLIGIPIYLFVFAIYYAVSALFGVIYRSPIVCIVVTILFWGACFLVGTLKDAFEKTIWSSAQIVRVFDVDDSVMAVDEIGVTYQWDDEEHKWNQIFLSQEQKESRGALVVSPLFGISELRDNMQPIGPVYDEKHQRLISAQAPFPPQGNRLLTVGLQSDDWKPQTENTTPTGTQAIFREQDGNILLVSSVGLFRITGDPLAKKQPVKLFGIELPLKAGGPLDNVGPRDTDATVLTRPSTAAMDESTGKLALYTRGTITLLDRTDKGHYEVAREHRLDGEERQAVAMSIGGSSIVLGRDDGRVQVLDAATFKERLSLKPEGPNQVRFITTSPDGQSFAILFHNGKLWLYDAASNELSKADVAGQGGIASATFSSTGDLYVADQAVRVSVYSLSDLTLQHRYSPRLGVIMRIYRYGLSPFYTIFPKPGELGTTFNYFLSGKETQASSSSDENLSASQRDLDPWSPLWSSALFMVVVLGIACVYIERQEF